MKNQITLALVILFSAVTNYVRTAQFAFDTTKWLNDCLTDNPDFFPDLTECYSKSIRNSSLPHDPNNARNTAIRVCDAFHPQTCASKHVGLWRTCLTEDKGQEQLESVLDMATVGHRYMCDNDGAKVKEFLKHGGIECLNEFVTRHRIRIEIEKCISRVLNEEMPQQVEEHVDVETQHFLTCGFAEKRMDCVLRSMECENEKPRELVEGLFRALLENMACWEHYVAHSSGSDKNHSADLWFYSVSLSVLVLAFSY